MKYLSGLIVLLFGVTVLAQDMTCPEIVSQALSVTAESCSELGRNEACYGNLRIETTYQENTQSVQFEQAGDIVGVADIQTITLSTMQSPDEWGVAMMSLQADLPDTLPGQNVTLLMFGDVAVENFGEPQSPSIQFTATNTFNVRSYPGSDFPVIGALFGGTTTSITGRYFDWLQIRMPAIQQAGWIYVAPGSYDIDRTLLAEIDPFVAEPPSIFAPMSSFLMRSGVGDAQCEEAPQSGMLVQTPSGAATVTLTANDVLIEVGSTIFMQAVPGDFMRVMLLEGTTEVTVAGYTLIVVPGTQAVIPLDSTGHASGQPRLLPYDMGVIEALPIDLLPEAIEPAPPQSVSTDSPDITPDETETPQEIPQETETPLDDDFDDEDEFDDEPDATAEPNVTF